MRVSARHLAEALLAGLLLLALWLAAGRLLALVPLHFVAELRLSGKDQLQLYYDQGRGFSEADTAYFDLVPQTQWQSVNHPLPAAIKSLRIDPLRGAGELYVKRLQLCRMGFCLNVLPAADKLSGVLVDRTPDGHVRLNLSGNDPQIELSAMERLDAQASRHVRLVLFGWLSPLAGVLAWVYFSYRHRHRYRQQSAKPMRAAAPAALFLLLLWLPLMAMPLNLFDISERYELRHKATRPVFSLSEWLGFPARFEAWFNDNFGLRGYLVTAGNWLTLSLFPGDSPDKRVLIGQQDWLYFSGQPALTSIHDYQGRRPFSPQQLETIRRHLLKRQDWLAARGIHYLLVIAPNKESLYPEFLPSHQQKVVGPSRLDQLADWLHDKPAPNWIDLRPQLFQAKATQSLPLFYRTDSHWNKYGAFIGYQAIFSIGHRLGWMPEPLQSEQFALHNRPGFMGDLAQMLLAHDRYADSYIELTPRSTCRLQVIDPQSNQAIPVFAPLGKDLRRYHSECGTAGPLIVLHDSFSWNLIPYIAPHYHDSYFVQQSSFPVELIDQVKPVLLIQEYVERDLQLILNAATAGESLPLPNKPKAVS